MYDAVAASCRPNATASQYGSPSLSLPHVSLTLPSCGRTKYRNAIASEETVERLPALLPECLTVLDHHAPHRGLALGASDAPLLGRVPGRSGRDRPVDDHADVEDRVEPRGRCRWPIASTTEPGC